jgi:hypothetical protein
VNFRRFNPWAIFGLAGLLAMPASAADPAIQTAMWQLSACVLLAVTNTGARDASVTEEQTI